WSENHRVLFAICATVAHAALCAHIQKVIPSYAVLGNVSSLDVQVLRTEGSSWTSFRIVLTPSANIENDHPFGERPARMAIHLNTSPSVRSEEKTNDIFAPSIRKGGRRE
ncbi:unnamed protein product, partial [Nesidiocoris tenuis]